MISMSFLFLIIALIMWMFGLETLEAIWIIFAAIFFLLGIARETQKIIKRLKEEQEQNDKDND